MPESAGLPRASDHGLGHELRGGGHFVRQPVDDLLVFGRVLGVARRTGCDPSRA